MNDFDDDFAASAEEKLVPARFGHHLDHCSTVRVPGHKICDCGWTYYLARAARQGVGAGLELERLRALSEAAYSGKWKHVPNLAVLGSSSRIEDDRMHQIADHVTNPNGAFIVAAVNYVRDLLARQGVGAELDVERLAVAMRTVWPNHYEGSGGTGGNVESHLRWRVLDPAVYSDWLVNAIAAEYSRLALRQPVEGSEK